MFAEKVNRKFEKSWKTTNDFLLNFKPINFYQIQTFPTNKSLQIQTFTTNRSLEVSLNIQYLGLNSLKKIIENYFKLLSERNIAGPYPSGFRSLIRSRFVVGIPVRISARVFFFFFFKKIHFIVK